MKPFKIVAFLVFIGISRGWAGQDFDSQIEPSPGDNFLEAAFRFNNPEPGQVPERILVYISGTDGDARGVVDDPAFLEACRKCHAALVGCYFRGEGLSYDIPNGGSGKALDKALASFAAQTGKPELAQMPLLLMGFSEGSQFTFNYVAWHPERVEAFAAIKAGGFALEPNDRSFRVPGLLVAGQYDEPIRIRATARAFLGSAGKNSRWSFLYEKGAGHDMTRIESFALQFLDAVCENAGQVVYRHADTGAAAESSGDPDLCWFPNEITAVSWASFYQRTPLSVLAQIPDLVGVGSVLQAAIDPPSFDCANGQRRTATISLSTSQPDVSIQEVSILGLGFALTGPTEGKPPLHPIVSFMPVNFDWGPVSAEVTISAEQAGHELAPETITLHGVVEGLVIPVPRLLYLGMVHPQETVSKTVRFKVSGPGVHIAKITSPPNIIATWEQIPGVRDLSLQVAWTPSQRLGAMAGEIRISFDEPEKGTLRIPVVGVVERP